MGTGALISYGLPRQITDLDVLVRDEAWEMVRSHPEAESCRGALTGDEVVKLHDGQLEFFATWIGGSTTAEVIDRGELILFEDWGSSHRLRFAGPADTLDYKTRFSRPKDLADLAAIWTTVGPVASPLTWPSETSSRHPARQCPDNIVIATATAPSPPAPIKRSSARWTIRYLRRASQANLRTSSA